MALNQLVKTLEVHNGRTLKCGNYVFFLIYSLNFLEKNCVCDKNRILFFVFSFIQENSKKKKKQ